VGGRTVDATRGGPSNIGLQNVRGSFVYYISGAHRDVKGTAIGDSPNWLTRSIEPLSTMGALFSASRLSRVRMTVLSHNPQIFAMNTQFSGAGIQVYGTRSHFQRIQVQQNKLRSIFPSAYLHQCELFSIA
jgi:hypothetical protein